ncbi:MAG TPA: neutral zinc metallopeptidase, partial [Thiolinea sp.]|nr:neutral zinc metallopeptidase [Thiolinea sp.]
MLWKSGRRSSNVEDRRSGIGAPAKVGGIGLILMLVVAWLMGADTMQLLGIAGSNLVGTTMTVQQPTPEQQEDADFVSAIVAQTEDVWGNVFQAAGRTYKEPRLVMFSDQMESACGYASAATGPFYCPADQ